MTLSELLYDFESGVFCVSSGVHKVTNMIHITEADVYITKGILRAYENTLSKNSTKSFEISEEEFLDRFSVAFPEREYYTILELTNKISAMKPFIFEQEGE